MMLVVNLNEYKGSSICALARHIIAQGYDPDRVVQFRRGSTKVFTTDHTLAWWAAKQPRESTKGEWMKLVPYDGGAVAGPPRSATERP